MTPKDWSNIALTVLGVFGLAAATRLAKRRMQLPSISPWLAVIPYNLIWLGILLAGRYAVLSLPGFAAPIGIVGGNAAIINLFGFPRLGPAAPKKAVGGRRASVPDREPLIPRAKKKKRQKRRR